MEIHKLEFNKDKKTILTGDRPTGHLHLGHFVYAPHSFIVSVS